MEYNVYKLSKLVDHKKVLFVTTKNIDYIRNVQEIKILEQTASDVSIIYSNNKSYIVRVLSVWNQLRKNKVEKVDVLFIGFAPQLIIPFLEKRLKGKPIIIDFFISVYDTLIYDRKKFKPNGIIAKICYGLDKRTLQKADYIIADTRAHANYFISEFNGKAEKFETIYLEADKTIYYPRPQNKPEELKNKFVVLYFGSILPLQGVNIVLNAIRGLKDKKDIYFDIIGPIPEKYNKPVQDNVRYIDWLSQEELAEHIANADLCLAGHFNGDIDKAKRTIPGKAYIYEMMGKPMILGDGIANHELFSEDMKHKFVPMGSASALKDAIKGWKL